MANVKLLKEKAKEIRKLTLRCIGTLGVGHVGGSMSVCELLSVLYYDKMRVDPKNPKWDDRDRLVVSKGHAGPAVYATLASKGFIPIEQLDTLNQPHTDLPSHCDKNHTPGIDMTTGSLGQGFAVAVGMAAAAKMDHRNLTIYTIVGDGECQEGQIWESALFAGNYGLDNLIAFVDYNKMQCDGYMSAISDMYPFDDKWKAFNWYVQVIDGHNVEEIANAIDNASKVKRPSVIIMNTVKGKGANFCENLPTCHHMTVTDEMWKNAVAALDQED